MHLLLHPINELSTHTVTTITQSSLHKPCHSYTSLVKIAGSQVSSDMSSRAAHVGSWPADARLQRWIGQYGRAVLSKLRPPDFSIDSVAMRRSEVNFWVAGETVPRHFEQVDAVVRLARDYQGLEMDLSGEPTTPHI